MSAKHLIRNATVVSMDPKIGIQDNCDVLINGQLIEAVGPGLAEVDGAVIIDGTDAIVCPGFIDTHRHMWQTQLAGLLSDGTLLEYFSQVRSVYGSCYTPRDTYLGNHCGALQCLDNGTTFIIDHSHIINSPEHADAAAQGLLDAKIRGVFCYGLFVNNQPTWADIDTGIKPQSDPDWRLEDSKRVRDKFFPSNGPTTLLRFGFAPTELEVGDFEQARKDVEFGRSINSAIITGHCALGKSDWDLRIVRQLNEKGLLDRDMLFSHAAGLQPDELEAVKKFDVGLSATPDTELQMAMGPPGAFKFREAGCSRVGLGTDVSCSNPPDMFAQMRLLLQSERQTRSVAHEGGPPPKVPIKCMEVLEFATMGGARAVGMEDYIGSITPGKRADLLIVKTDSPRMSPVNDPVAALVMYANASDVDTVFVDGNIVKQNGKLKVVDWPKVSTELRSSTKAILDRSKDAPFDGILQHVLGLVSTMLARTKGENANL